MNRQFRFSKKLVDAIPPHPADSRSREGEYSDTEVAGLRLLVNRTSLYTSPMDFLAAAKNSFIFNDLTRPL